MFPSSPKLLFYRYNFWGYLSDKVLMQIRNQRICQELDNKTSTIQQLVRRYHITRQQITNIYREYNANKRQLGLFFD